jgi:uncharacterized repeat protein (TIGR03809 family)
MPALPGVPRFDQLAQRWLELAERRLAFFSELYRSGRWRRYYTPEQFAERVTDAMKVVTTWRVHAGKPPGTPTDKDLPPAA